MPNDNMVKPTDRIHTQQADALKRNAEIVAELGGPGESIEEVRAHADAVRAVWNYGGPEMAVNEARSIPGPFRDVPVQFYRPTVDGTLPVFVYLHGGRLSSPPAGIELHCGREVPVTHDDRQRLGRDSSVNQPLCQAPTKIMGTGVFDPYPSFVIGQPNNDTCLLSDRRDDPADAVL